MDDIKRKKINKFNTKIIGLYIFLQWVFFLFLFSPRKNVILTRPVTLDCFDFWDLEEIFSIEDF